MQKYNVTKSLGGLNQDDEVRFIPAGDYIYAENLRTAITEGGRMGTQTNVRGNWLITQYNCPYTDVFPQGTNKTLGFCEDIKNNSIIFFNWNSNNEHGIYRFWRDRTDANNPYGVCDQIVSYDFGWEETQRITSASIVYGETGDLLYWTDNVMPRKVNLTKGNLVGKLKSWDLYLPVTCDLPSIVTFTFKNKAGGVVYSVGEVLLDPTNRTEIIKNIAENINSNVDSPVIAEACECHLKFVEKVSGELWTITVDTGAIMIVPDNWYGSVLIERFFDRCKYPFLEPPLMEFAIDADYDPNYVKNKVFQSRLQPFYDDNEGSSLTLGVWSQIPINNLGCDGTSAPQYNYIDINFNDSSIANPQTLVLLKKINLIMREHNTGADRKIILLEPCDFLDYDYTPNAEKWVVHYKFYNDIISSAIDSATAAKLFDDVPLKSDAELYVKNKIVEGGILEGYNAPACIDAKAQMEFGDSLTQKVYTIRGVVRFFNFFLDNNTSTESRFTSSPNILEKRSPILFDSAVSQYPYFGGVTVKNNIANIANEAVNDCIQLMPEGGVPAYLAGTDYVAFSKQKSIVQLTQTNNGVIDITSNASKDNLKNFYQDSNYSDKDVFSEFEIHNVPNGVYVLRLGSHWCSFQDENGKDKLGKGFMYNVSSGRNYQKTSTNVWGVNLYDSTTQLYTWQPHTEVTVTVNNGDVFIGEFLVADLCYYTLVGGEMNFAYQAPVNGYLYDARGSVDIVDLGNGVSIEKAQVIRDYTFVAQSVSPLGSVTSSVVVDIGKEMWTDHNGYFFCVTAFEVTGFQPEIRSVTYGFRAFQVGAANVPTKLYINNDKFFTNTTTSAIQGLFDGNLTAVIDSSPLFNTTKLRDIIMPCTNKDARGNCSTFIKGIIADSFGNKIDGILVIYQNGKYFYTQNGVYNILAWGDAISLCLTGSQGNIRVDDSLIYNGITPCGFQYPNGQIYSSVQIVEFGSNTIINDVLPNQPPFSPTSKYVTPDFTIDELNNPAIKAHKRGGNYTYGLRLYDNAGRLCSVVKAFEMYVPFITEDIGKYSIENFSSVVYPANTFKYGKPSIKWVLASNTTFPTWATTFQWMRVKNSIYGRYLQWVANKVTYLSATATALTPEFKTVFQNGDAVAIKISLSNITRYYADHNNSQIGYTYQIGDRLRLIANRDIINYQGLTDFEITSYDSATQSVIVKTNGFPTEIQSGTLFEIFNPKSVETTDEQTYYEVGEVVNINNGIPEKFSGIFTNGDTYWRGRLIIVNDDATKFASAYPVVIEDASISDFYVSQDQDIGRIGIIDPNFKQIYNPAKLRVSNDYQVSSANNGLSSFEELNQKELDKSYGEIKRLFFVNNNLVVVTQNKEVSNYIGIVTIQQASKGVEAGILSTTDQFFGTDYYHSKLLGADFAGSVVFNNNSQLMGYNSRLANVWQYEQNGEQVISDVKMINYFKGLAGKVTDCVGIYDRNYEEYILTIWRDGVPETLAWCEAKKRWTTFYSFTPECYASLGAEIYSFSQGALYIHDKNPTRNLFYGFQQGVSKLNVVFNSEPDLYKNWQMCILKTLQDNYANDWEVPMIYNDNKQQSRLVKGSWTKRGEDWFASFKRNLLNPTVANPILNAEPLRSSTLTCELVNAYTGDMRLYSWDSGYNYSERTLPK